MNVFDSEGKRVEGDYKNIDEAIAFLDKNMQPDACMIRLKNRVPSSSTYNSISSFPDIQKLAKKYSNKTRIVEFLAP